MTHRTSALQDKVGPEVHWGSSNSGSRRLRIPYDRALNADNIFWRSQLLNFFFFFSFLLCRKLQAERASHFSAVIWLVSLYWSFPVGQEKSRNCLAQQGLQRWRAHLRAHPAAQVPSCFRSLLGSHDKEVVPWTSSRPGCPLKTPGNGKEEGSLVKYQTLLSRGKHLLHACLCLV